MTIEERVELLETQVSQIMGEGDYELEMAGETIDAVLAEMKSRIENVSWGTTEIAVESGQAMAGADLELGFNADKSTMIIGSVRRQATPTPYTGATVTFHYIAGSGNIYANLTMHKMFWATACPGPYLGSKFPYIASEVNKQLGVSTSKSTSTATSTAAKSYIVQITYRGGVNVRKGAGISNAKTGETAKYGLKYTIVEEKTVSGQVWGRLKSGAGWICLSGFTKKV